MSSHCHHRSCLSRTTLGPRPWRVLGGPLAAAWALLGLVAACGGKAVMDGESPTAQGGNGGATTSTTASTSSSTTTHTTTTITTGPGGWGGAGGCDALQSDFEQKLAAAQACDPAINAIQCSGDTVAFDLCGCDVVANDYHGAQAQAARDAFDLWVAGGCGPYECYACPPPPSSPWYCDPTAKQCMPAYEGH
jgi:hypothetical protein